MIDNDMLNNEDLLFHYTKREIGLKYILKKMQLKLSLVNNTNDPYEYRNWNYTMSYWGDENETIPKVREKDKDLLKKGTKMLCFCTNSSKNSIFAKGYAKARMWSQYGENHKGLCFIFNKTSFENAIKISFKKDALIFKDFVKYENCNTIPQKVFSLKYEAWSKNWFDARNEHLKTNYKHIFFQKNEDYSSESEYRIVVCNSEDKDEYISIKDSLLGVIVGDNCKICSCVLDFFQKKHNNLLWYKINWHNGVPSIRKI